MTPPWSPTGELIAALTIGRQYGFIGGNVCRSAASADDGRYDRADAWRDARRLLTRRRVIGILATVCGGSETVDPVREQRRFTDAGCRPQTPALVVAR